MPAKRAESIPGLVKNDLPIHHYYSGSNPVLFTFTVPILACESRTTTDYTSRLFFRGETIASCDSYGIVKLWDVRTVSPIKTIDVGPYPCNKAAFDPGCSVLSLSSSDGTIKMVDISTDKVLLHYKHCITQVTKTSGHKRQKLRFSNT